MGDADDSYDFSDLDHYLIALRDGNDLVMGNRFLGGIAEGAMPWSHRWIGNPVLSFIGRFFFRIHVRDFHCGLRGFNREKILALHLKTAGMEFASEMVIKAKFCGLTIAEVPTRLSRDGRSRPPHLRSFRDGWRHLRLMLLFSPRWLFLVPGLLLLTVGLLVTGRLMVSPVTIGGVSLSVQSLLISCLLSLTGVQLVAFAFFIRFFSAQLGFMPMPPLYRRMAGLFRLEHGLLAGTGAVVVGVAALAKALLMWRDAGFGALDPMVVMRWVIAMVYFSAIGIQVIFSSCFMTFIGFGYEHARFRLEEDGGQG
jgi:hypothetical protein